MRATTLLIPAVCFFVASSGCQPVRDPFAPGAYGCVAGCVLDDRGTPAVGAIVSSSPGATSASTSDAEGRFLLCGVPTGEVALRISGPRREVWTTSTVVVPEGTRELPCLRPSGRIGGGLEGHGSLRACIVSSDGRPASGAEIWAKGRHGSTHVRADVSGCFRLDRLSAGAATIVIDRGAEGATVETAIVRDRVMVHPTIVLAPKAWLTGAVVLAGGGDGLPPSEIITDNGPYWTWSRADGSFALAVPSGACFDLRAQSLDMKDSAVQHVCATTSSTAPSVFLRLEDSDGPPEPRVYVELAEIPRAKGFAAVALDGTKLYVVGGQECTLPDPERCPFAPYQTADVQTHDFATGVWRGDEVPRAPMPRAGAAAAFFEGRLWVMGGIRSLPVGAACRPENFLEHGSWVRSSTHCFLNLVEVYDPMEQRWTTGRFSESSGNWIGDPDVPQLPSPVGFAAVGVTSQALYLVSGASAGSYLNIIQTLTHERGRPPRWTLGDCPLPYGRESAIGVAFGRRFIVVGGGSYDDDGDIPDRCRRELASFYFPRGVWERNITEAPYAYQSQSGGAVAAGRFLHFVGWGENHFDNGIHSFDSTFDTRSETWTFSPQLPPAYPRHTGFSVTRTPHGYLKGPPSQWAPQSRAVYASVGERFLTRALGRYARRALPVIEPSPLLARPSNRFPAADRSDCPPTPRIPSSSPF